MSGGMMRDQVPYVCKSMLDIPNIFKYDSEMMNNVLHHCDSKLEFMFMLGSFFQVGIASPGHWCEIVSYPDNEMIGTWVLDPWPLWEERGKVGPSALAFVCQYPFEYGHHDFGVFYGDDNGNPGWEFQYAIEVDGYQTHKDRREKDAYRDASVSYPVYRFYEEQHNPLTYFSTII